MTTAVVPFNFGAPAANLAVRRANSKNVALMSSQGASFPTMSIKGKVFTLVKDGERKPLVRTMTDPTTGLTETMPISMLPLAVVHGNPKARVYYATGFKDGDDNQRPTCMSYNGVSPEPTVEHKQAAKCALCPHAAWGSKVRNDAGPDDEAKGTACAPRTRLAVTDPTNPKVPFLLDLPPASRRGFNDALKLLETHGKDFNEVAFKVSFDMESATPKLKFEPYGVLGAEAYQAVLAMAETPVVAEIIGAATAVEDAPPAPAPAAQAPVTPPPPPAPAPAPAADPVVSMSDLDGVLDAANAAAAAVTKAKAAPKPRAKAEAPAPAPAAAPAPAPAASAGGDLNDLLGGLSSLLGNKDD